jgi:hypothetical protein
MTERRSFYLDSKQNDFAEPIGEARRLDFTDIPFAEPVNDNALPGFTASSDFQPSRSLSPDARPTDDGFK